MKKILLICFLLIACNLSHAQDLIFKTDGTEIKSKVIEITKKEIKYNKYEQPNGPLRNIDIADVFMIIYQDGTREVFKKENSIQEAKSNNSIIIDDSFNNDSFVDIRDGKKYKVVKINGKIWMAENLSYNLGYGCWTYNNDERNAIKYGRLYTWDAAKKACPSGWHLPSNLEWIGLAQFILKEREGTIINSNKDQMYDESVGRHLKSKFGWNSSRNGTDAYGFSGLPAGYRNVPEGNYFQIGESTFWWTSTKGKYALAWNLNNGDYFGRYDNYEGSGFSVRCVKD